MCTSGRRQAHRVRDCVCAQHLGQEDDAAQDEVERVNALADKISVAARAKASAAAVSVRERSRQGARKTGTSMALAQDALSGKRVYLWPYTLYIVANCDRACNYQSQDHRADRQKNKCGRGLLHTKTKFTQPSSSSSAMTRHSNIGGIGSCGSGGGRREAPLFWEAR